MCLGFSAISSLVVTFIRSSGAFTSLSVIVGTIVGFLAGAYIPAGTMSEGVVSVLNTLPFAQSAMLLREPLAGGALERLTDGLPGADETIATYFGFELSVGDVEITTGIVVAILLGITLVCGALGALRMRKSVS